MKRKPSIKTILLYGFGALVLGALVSGIAFSYLVFKYESILANQKVAKDAYDSIFVFKYNTERLLTTPELPRQRRLWEDSAATLQTRLDALVAAVPQQAEQLDGLWQKMQVEMRDIRRQLDHPVFSDRNLMEKSLLRRLGEGLNANESSEYYVRVRTLVNAVDFLQQYEDFLLGDLAAVNERFVVDGNERLRRTKQLLISVPILAFVVLVGFAARLYRLTGNVERELLRIQGNLSEALGEVEAKQQKLREQRDILHHLAHHDTLTGLPNRLLFLERLRHGVKSAKRRKEKLALLFIDLDRFKEINDSLGHGVGDMVLKAVSSRFRQALRGDDTFARLGGDEFTVLLERVDSPNGVAVLAQKIIQVMSEPIHVANQELYITCSIGISLFPDHGRNADLLMRNADSAMYKAKDEGKNNYQFYAAEMTRSAYERVKLETNLRKALEQQEFEVFYQPQMNSVSGTLLGFEALIRWRHRDFGLVSPASFIPIAEETGLIVPIGEWVLDTAARQAVDWHRKDLQPGRVAVNLSAKQLTHGDVLGTVKRVLQATGCRPEWLALEVTEGLIMVHPDQAAELLRELSELGLEIAIDDFGTGYSSLAYLKHLPIDKLKIDQSFVRSVPHDPDDSEIVKAVIAMAQGLRVDVIAEGVESREQADFLATAGCSAVQGFLYGRPLAAAAAEALMLPHAEAAARA